MKDTVKLRAMGKINLGLDVLKKREDGYHEVRMIMQTVRLYDQILIKYLDEPGIKIRSNLYYLPNNENNLCYKAANILMEKYQIKQGISIELYKKIPVAAGMAGGSADAAAVLVGLNKLFALSLKQNELMEYGLLLGADVPYCIMRGTALAEGLGEKLTRLEPMPDCYILIAKPQVSLSTKLVYESLHAHSLDEIEHPQIDKQLEALRTQNLSELVSSMGNVLENVSIEIHPVIQELKDSMLKGGAMGAMMSGSGPTVFGIFDDKNRARKAMEHIKAERKAKQVYLTTPFNVREQRAMV